MNFPHSYPNDLNNKNKKTKRPENKSLSDSSCSDYNSTNNKRNWKHAVTQDGVLFYIKRSKQSSISGSFLSPSTTSNSINQNKNIPLKCSKLAQIKNSDINKELYLIVSSMDRYRFGRRSSIIESMLGFGVIPFSDNFDCLMVSNIIDNSLNIEHPCIQEGDWFKAMDNIEVRTGNIDKLLMQYTTATKVKLTFKSLNKTKIDFKEDINYEMADLNSFSEFVINHKQLFEVKNPSENQTHVFLTLIINRQYFQAENNDFLYYYPFLSNNFLYMAKGSFLTLDSLISNDLRTKAIQSTIVVNNMKYYITYGHIDDTLIVCAFASSCLNKHQTKANSNDFFNFLKFNILNYHNLETQHYLNQVCDIFKNNIIRQSSDSTLNFSFLENSSLGMSLPKEAQLRICDALSEFESMDHKKWNETNKMFSDLIVCGTALYYNKFLLSSSLPADLRTAIECTLRVRGLITFHNVKEMFIWEEIITKIEDSINKHYLAVCFHNDLLFVTVLKNPLKEQSNSNVSCIPYIEEIVNTIDYLLSSGIDFISQFWIDSTKRPSIKKFSQSLAKRKFSIQKDISIDNVNGNNMISQESPAHSLLSSSQIDEGNRKSFETESISDSFNDLKEFHNKDGECIEPLLNEMKNIMPMCWTAGWSNDLRFFVHWNCADGILFRSLKPMCSDIHLEVVKESIYNIHNIIHSYSNAKKKNRDSINTGWNRNVVLREFGTSVNLKNNDLKESEILFIVGRLFLYPLREIYVCFGPNYSQNLVELAFRMSLLNVG